MQRSSLCARLLGVAALVAALGGAPSALAKPALLPHDGRQPEQAAPAPLTPAAAQAPPGVGGDEVGEVVVRATRTPRRVQDEPLRVEVLGREEIEEKILMRPGDISMIVAETGGLRVQNTSPALGAANIRVRGLDGRYTQVLADGLPLYGTTTSLGLLQIAPTDLGQVEVIKGAASALYGPAALGGVINLVSRRPGEAAAAELLLNATSLDGQDATAYAAGPLSGGWAASLTGGLHRQTRQDLDGDGWADLPAFDRLTLRPRLFWTGADGAQAFLTVGALREERSGGTLPGRTVPDGRPFPQVQDTTRFDGGLVAQRPLAEGWTLHARASAMTQAHGHLFGASREDDRHTTAFGEASVASDTVRTSWLLGAAVQADLYRQKVLPGFDYSYVAPAVFAQLEHRLADDLTLAASGRVDAHTDFGTRFSPRVSLLWRPGRWTVRGSVGQGFYAPTPFVDEIEAAGLARLELLSDLDAEEAITGSLDVAWAVRGLELEASLFAADVDGALRLEDAGPARVRLVNMPGTVRTRGVELLARRRWGGVSVTGSYVHVDATEAKEAGVRRTVARTPHHTAGAVAVYERPGRGRIGFEAYYTGRQRLEDNPYRREGRRYLELGILAEVALGRRVSLFLNLENLLDVRQTKLDPLLLPARARDGRWTTDVWAPTEGFVANGGVRLRFGSSA